MTKENRKRNVKNFITSNKFEMKELEKMMDEIRFDGRPPKPRGKTTAAK